MFLAEDADVPEARALARRHASRRLHNQPVSTEREVGCNPFYYGHVGGK